MRFGFNLNALIIHMRGTTFLKLFLGLVAVASFAGCTTTEAKREGCKTKVGIVFDIGGKNDRSFNAAAWEGVQKADKDLPEDLQKLSPAEREKTIATRIAERKKIRAEILELSKQRDAYIAAERKKLGQSTGFDTAVAAALKEQLLKKGIR